MTEQLKVASTGGSKAAKEPEPNSTPKEMNAHVDVLKKEMSLVYPYQLYM